MPPKTSSSTSKLLARYGNRARQAHDAHKNDEMKVNDFSSLPPGINPGVAQLESCGIREIPAGRKENVGELEFFATAVVHDPIDHQYEDPPGSRNFKTVRVAGKQTRYREPLCDTPNAQGKKKTFDDHYAAMLNLFRIWGYDTSNMAVDEVESVAAALSQSKPFFKFRTSLLPAVQGQEARVYDDWTVGPVDDGWQPPESHKDVDNTARPSANGAAPKSAKPATPPASQEPAADLEFGDLDSLLEAASLNDQSPPSVAAQDKLKEMAVAAGKTEDEVDEADSWDDVVEWIKEGSSGDAEPEYEKGQVWRTRLPDKSGKKSKALTKVEITSVNNDKGTVDVKSLVDKKVHKGIAFGDLVEDD